jgi:mevalonate kinase
MLIEKFYSNGKLLITGEYLVLDGAISLALPTKYGQDLKVEKVTRPFLIWESFDQNGSKWFHSKFELPTLKPDLDSNNEIVQTLESILKEAQRLNPEFLSDGTGFHIKTKLSFPKNWGLGTSSTVINNIAEWANVDAFELLKNSFGGSGYDIACAQNNSPILYSWNDDGPTVESVKFNPNFKDRLYFVHLNKKQDSKEGIKAYKNVRKRSGDFTEEISAISRQLLNCTNLSDFDKLLAEHEKIIASILTKIPVQQELFSDYFGQTKSLGAWGGDFILATGNKDTRKYFKSKGFETVISYQDMIL